MLDHALTLVALLVVGYAASRFGTTLFDNLRNAVFERVGQDATRLPACWPKSLY